MPPTPRPASTARDRCREDCHLPDQPDRGCLCFPCGSFGGLMRHKWPGQSKDGDENIGGTMKNAWRPLAAACALVIGAYAYLDRKSTRLNSSHLGISYAVFC